MSLVCPDPDCEADFATEQQRASHYHNAHIRDYALPEINHATPAGYQQHKRRDEQACPDCLQAWSAWQKKRRSRKGK